MYYIVCKYKLIVGSLPHIVCIIKLIASNITMHIYVTS